MKRDHTDTETRTEARAADRDRAAAREVVTDILAEALWTLICSGHGPSAPASQQPRMTSLSSAAGQRAQVRQPLDNTRN